VQAIVDPANPTTQLAAGRGGRAPPARTSRAVTGWAVACPWCGRWLPPAARDPSDDRPAHPAARPREQPNTSDDSESGDMTAATPIRAASPRCGCPTQGGGVTTAFRGGPGQSLSRPSLPDRSGSVTRSFSGGGDPGSRRGFGP
jgi:hypothetical protein